VPEGTRAHTHDAHAPTHVHMHTHVDQHSLEHVNQHHNALRPTYHSTISLHMCQGVPMKLLGLHRPSVMGVKGSGEHERLQKSPSCAGTKASTAQPT
jgi:hypothetical protein